LNSADINGQPLLGQVAQFPAYSEAYLTVLDQPAF